MIALVDDSRPFVLMHREKWVRPWQLCEYTANHEQKCVTFIHDA